MHCLLISEGFLPLKVASHTIKFQSLRPISDIVSCLLTISMIPNSVVSFINIFPTTKWYFYILSNNSKWPKRWDLRKKKKNNPRTEGRMLELGLPRNQISHQNGFSASSASKSTNCTPKRKFMRNQNCCVRVIVVKRNQNLWENLWENIRIVVLWEIRFEKSSSMCFESCKQTLLDGDTN